MSEANTVRVVAGAGGCEAAVRAGAVAIVVDALRASATITSMIEAGASSVWVTAHVDQARRLRDSLDAAFLVGERKGFPPEGFDAGNSPESASGLGLEGRDVVFTSTTGARRLVQLDGAKAVLVGGPVNANAVAALASARADGAPIYVVAAGLRGKPGSTAEDWLGAALVATEFQRLGRDWVDPEGGRGRHWPDEITAETIAEGLAESSNGRWLIEHGLGDDVAACGRVDWLTAVAAVRRYRELDAGPPAAELGRGDR